MNDQNEIAPIEESIDMRRFALLMLDWEAKKKDLARVEQELKESVGVLKKTQNVGNVVAKYTKGRVSYDYVEAANRMIAPEELARLEQDNTVVSSRVDYRVICEQAGVDKEDVHASEEGAPSISIKLVE